MKKSTPNFQALKHVHTRIMMDRTGVIRRIDYDAPENEREAEVIIDAKEARAFLKSLIHEYDALFWDEDLSDADDEDYDIDEEAEAPSPDRKPMWSLLLELNNGEEKMITFYNQMHDAAQELFLSLLGYFKFDDEDYDSDSVEDEI